QLNVRRRLGLWGDRGGAGICHGCSPLTGEVAWVRRIMKGKTIFAKPGCFEGPDMSTHPVALVTGGSRGIGRGICLELAQHGYAVGINYAGNEDAARQTQQLIGAGVPTMLCRADVAVPAERDRMVEDVLANWGRIDVLVNNAGITSVGRRDILEATEDSWDRVLGVNLKGPYFLTQRVAQAMLSMAADLTNPAIVNISSLSAYSIS